MTALDSVTTFAHCYLATLHRNLMFTPRVNEPNS